MISRGSVAHDEGFQLLGQVFFPEKVLFLRRFDKDRGRESCQYGDADDDGIQVSVDHAQVHPQRGDGRAGLHLDQPLRAPQHPEGADGGFEKDDLDAGRHEHDLCLHVNLVRDLDRAAAPRGAGGVPPS